MIRWRRGRTGSSRAPLVARLRDRARSGAVGGMLSRLMIVLAVVLGLAATFAVILVLTVRVTDGQYRMVDLRNEELALQQEAESLTQDLDFHRAPQNLAIAAQEEGMVPAPAEQGVVDLSSGEVWGEAVPAAPSSQDEDEIDSAVPVPIQVGSSAAEEAQADARQRRDALPETQEKAEEQLKRAQKVESDVELLGGTLPGPQQRSSSAAPTTEGGTSGEADGNAAVPSAQPTAARTTEGAPG